MFFSDSGSVAVEVALKMAIQYWYSVGRPDKQKLVALRNGYHGDTFGAMSVCDPVPACTTCSATCCRTSTLRPPRNCAFDEDCPEQELAAMTELLAEHHEEIAAVIVEPVVQGAGGMRFYSPEYLVQLRALCDAFDVLLIFDEIATGFGRTGKMFALEHAGVEPDILCLGKALTGGYMTLAATLCNDAHLQRHQRGRGRRLYARPHFYGQSRWPAPPPSPVSNCCCHSPGSAMSSACTTRLEPGWPRRAT